MKRYWRLKYKIFLPLLIGILSTFLILTAIIINNETRLEKESRITNGISYADLSVQSYVKNFNLLYNTGFYKFSEIINDLLELNKNVNQVEIISIGGNILFDSNELINGKYDETIEGDRFVTNPELLQQISSYYRIVNEKDSTVDIIQPYIDEWGRHDYSLIYTVSLENLNNVIANSYMQVLPITIFLVLLFFITLFSFKYFIDLPLKKLNHGILQMEQGNLGVVVDINSHDEIGDLTKVFNKMSHELKETTENLELYNKNLEKAVSERTVELRKKNTELINTKEELEELNKNLETEIEKRTKKIEQLLKQKDDFINQLGHDLKNPLGPLVNLIPILEHNEKNPQNKELLEVVNRNVRYMKNLVIKTIQFAQLKSPNVKLQYEYFNLSMEIAEIIATNKVLFEQNNIHIQTIIEDDLYINADKLKIHELFNNILNNAVKYSNAKGVISIRGTHQHDHILLSVKDTGIGMNDEQLSHVFDEFYKADPSRHDFDSSGLGMPIAKRIVEKHGGSIWAESKGTGKGSIFYFTLPSSR